MGIKVRIKVEAAYATRQEAVAAGEEVRLRMRNPRAWRLKSVRIAQRLNYYWSWVLSCGELDLMVYGSKLCCSFYATRIEAALTANPEHLARRVLLAYHRELAKYGTEFDKLAGRLGYQLPPLPPPPPPPSAPAVKTCALPRFDSSGYARA